MTAKQIREQAELLCTHVHCEELDAAFIEMHAGHLCDLAKAMRYEQARKANSKNTAASLQQSLN